MAQVCETCDYSFCWAEVYPVQFLPNIKPRDLIPSQRTSSLGSVKHSPSPSDVALYQSQCESRVLPEHRWNTEGLLGPLQGDLPEQISLMWGDPALKKKSICREKFRNAKECDFFSSSFHPCALEQTQHTALTAGWLCRRAPSEGPLCSGMGIWQQATFLPGAHCHMDSREITKPERNSL